MNNAPLATPRRLIVLFLFALAGSVTGLLAGPHIVAVFDGAPAWLLPAVLCASVLLALVAAYLAFRLAGRRATLRSQH